jgi:hypothetical protein
MIEWVGVSFDPEFFDAHEANLAIHGGWVPREPEDVPHSMSAELLRERAQDDRGDEKNRF